MYVFGPATITWESLSRLSNGDVELWSSGNNNAPDNWYMGGVGSYSVARNTTLVYTNNSSCQLNTTGANSANYVTMAQNVHTALGINYWKGKPVKGYARVLSNNANCARLYFYDGVSSNASPHYTGNNNWVEVNVTRTIDNNATMVQFYPYAAAGDNVTRTTFWDTLRVVEGPYNLGKTFGGGELELYEHSYKGLRSQNITDMVYGGEGVIHMFQWNNTISITGNSALYDYGTIKIVCNNMTIVIDCAKIELGQSFAFGTYSQRPLDLRFSFRKSPDTGNVITFS